MRFIEGGPDIPLEILRAHEDGKLVFFCGAGISMPAGLPSFKGLVEEIYKACKTVLIDAEEVSFEKGELDKTLHLLERRLPGGRKALIRALHQVFDEKTKVKVDKRTHEALLRLAQNTDKTFRLVTTNYDRLFHRAGKTTKINFKDYVGASSYFTRDSHLDGLFFLHGLLDEDYKNKSNIDDNGFVLTSADFGLAYLSRSWASNFLMELFSKYNVCFVGYSLNDPILNYLMDGLSVIRTQEEKFPKVWILTRCEDDEAKQKEKWATMGVNPIFYQGKGLDHSLLLDTLIEWGEIHNNKISGNKEYFSDFLANNLKQENPNRELLLWILSEPSGEMIELFHGLKNSLSLNWLIRLLNSKANTEKRYLDLNILFDSNKVNLPAPLYKLAFWLSEYMEDLKLLDWINKKRGNINGKWRKILEHNLKNGNLPLFQLKIWSFSFLGRLQRNHERIELKYLLRLSQNKEQLKTLKLQVRNLFQPQIELLVSSTCKTFIKLKCNHLRARYLFREFLQDDFRPLLPCLFSTFEELLIEAIQLKNELNIICNPFGYFNRNGKYFLPDNCAVLLLLVKEAWLEIDKQDPVKAGEIVGKWHVSSFTILKNLASKVKLDNKTLDDFSELNYKTNKLEVLNQGREDAEEHKDDVECEDNEEYEDNSTVFFKSAKASQNLDELVLWLSKHILSDELCYLEDWKSICAENYILCIDALEHLANQDVWPVSYWQTALGIRSLENHTELWQRIVLIFIKMPDLDLCRLLFDLESWLNIAICQINEDKTLFLRLSNRIIEVVLKNANLQFEECIDFSSNSMSPIRAVVQHLINLWEKDNNGTFEDELKILLEIVCNEQSVDFNPGHFEFGNKLTTLYAIDELWTETNVLPLFNSENETVFAAVWHGFLEFDFTNLAQSNKFIILLEKRYADKIKRLLDENPNEMTELNFRKSIENSLLKASKIYSDFNIWKYLPFELFTVTALCRISALKPNSSIIDWLILNSFQKVLNNLSSDQLAQIIYHFKINIYELNGELPEEYWANQILPFWNICWPKNVAIKSDLFAEDLALIIIRTASKFPEALNTLKDWLQHLACSSLVISYLNDTTLCNDYPNEVLEFLCLIIALKAFFPEDLQVCLKSIDQNKLTSESKEIFNHLTRLCG